MHSSSNSLHASCLLHPFVPSCLRAFVPMPSSGPAFALYFTITHFGERSLIMADDRDTTRRTDAPADANPDAITGAPGSHPVGTGVGAAAAGAAGALAGSVVPGVGTAIGGAVGAVVGAVAGGLAGKGVAESINPTEEDAYWRENHNTRPYAS